MCFAIKQNYFCASLLLNAPFTFSLFHFKFGLKKYQACVFWVSTRGVGYCVRSRNEQKRISSGAWCCSVWQLVWFGWLSAYATASYSRWARPRGMEEFPMLSRAMSNSIPTCHRGWEAWRNLEDNALSSLHKLLRRRGWGGGTQFRWRNRHSGTLCILHIIPLWFALSIPDMYVQY